MSKNEVMNAYAQYERIGGFENCLMWHELILLDERYGHEEDYYDWTTT